MLVRVVKNWTYPNLFRQTPGGNGVWDTVHFTLEPVDKCDALLVLNQLSEDISVCCPPQNIWAVFQEPYVPEYLPWMSEGHGKFSRIYTHHPPNSNVRYIPSPPLVPWHVGMSYDELQNVVFHDKNDRIVWITSNKQIFPGHSKRYEFLQNLMNTGLQELDVYGHGIKPIEDKWDVLVKSRYAIAVENHCDNNYWTEKIADCWLAETLPFYYGCPNLEDYFPAESFVRININEHHSVAQLLHNMVKSGEYEKRLPAIRKARNLVLNQHQFFPFMARELMQNAKISSPALPVCLSRYKQSLLSRLKNRCVHVFRSINE